MLTLPGMAILLKLAVAGRLLVRAAMIVLGFGVLVWVVDRSDTRDAEVVIHVNEPDVEIQIGERVYPIVGSRIEPIVCQLAPGPHTLTMSRGGRLLYEQSIDLKPGGHIVCTAWDPSRIDERPAITRRGGKRSPQARPRMRRRARAEASAL